MKTLNLWNKLGKIEIIYNPQTMEVESITGM